MLRGAATIGLLLTAALLAGPSRAQQTGFDPIGALLDKPGRATPEMDEPDTASQTQDPVADPAVVLPVAPRPYTPTPTPYTAPSSSQAPQLTAPTHVEQTGTAPDGPPTITDMAYESRIRASFASAQRFQGPMDGSWTIRDQTGDLYALQLADKGKGVVEGAWRDLRRPAVAEASGLVDNIARTEGGLTLSFAPSPGGPMVVATLQGGGGQFSGQMDDQGRRRSVTMVKKGP